MTLRHFLSSRFRRITSSLNYIPEIDGIRFVAILLVFVFHLAGDILRHSPDSYRAQLAGDNFFLATQCFNYGVQMFFVVSGFVLALPFASQYLAGGKKVDKKRFYLRRLTRLEPPYMIALLLFFALKLVGGRGDWRALLPHLGASMAYLHNWIYGRPSDINFVAWSLEIEVQFYLLAPFIAAALFRIHRAALRRFLMAGLCVLASFVAARFANADTLSLVGQLPYFIAGFLLADLFLLDKDRSPARNRRVLCDLVCVLCVPLIVWYVHFGWLLIFTGPLTLCAAYYAALHGNWVRAFLRNPVITAIGGMCYSIYLIHNYIIAAVGMATERLTLHLPFEARLAVQGVLIGSVVLVLSSAYYLLFERPCMRPDWPSRLARWVRARVEGFSSAPAPASDPVVAREGNAR